MQLHWHQFHILVCARETILHVEIVHGTNVISTSSDAMWSPLFLFILSILSPYALFAISLCHLVNIFISQMEYSAPKGIYFFCFFSVLGFGSLLLARWQKCNGRALQFMCALFSFLFTYLTVNTRICHRTRNSARTCMYVCVEFFLPSSLAFFSFFI